MAENQLVESSEDSSDNFAIEFEAPKVCTQNSKSRSNDSCFSERHTAVDQFSRYKNDFEEISSLGEGGYGRVMKVKHKTDRQKYAVKIIKLCHPHHDTENTNTRLKQEAEFLASFQHKSIVRYHASWIESWKRRPHCVDQGSDEITANDNTPSISESSDDHSTTGLVPYLFIQMELCVSTLRSVIDSKILTHEGIAEIFGAVVQGLKYVHSKGICHRDLTPNNILLDEERKPKIGDFGLARLSVCDECGSGESALSSSLSKDIGTHAYKAPEITSDSYDQRVDIYSLGIIFFEMCYPMNTKSERVKVLEKLRSSDIILPDNLNVLPWQEKLIRSLLNHSAEERITLDKVLSLLLEEHPLQGTNISDVLSLALLDPTSRSYQKVIDSCFLQDKKSSVDGNYATARPQPSETRTLCSIIKFIENIYRKHGASHLQTPLLTPSTSDESESAVHLMTRDGVVVNLPHNAKVDFARYVVMHNLHRITRYDTLQTYKEHGSRVHPRPKYECVFDTLRCDGDVKVADAQVLSVLAAVFNCIMLEDHTVHFIAINHRDLVKAVLLSVGVKKQYLSNAIEIIGRNGYKEGLKQLEPHQISECGLDILKLETIMDLRGSPNEMKDKFMNEITNDCKEAADQALNYLLSILQFNYNVVGNRNPVFGISFKWCNNVHYYSGIMFTAVRVHYDKRRDIVIADGGRYDDILSSCQAEMKDNGSKKSLHGCGISVYPIKVLHIQQDFWPPELVVLTCQGNEDIRKSVFDMAHKLRMVGFNCREEFNVEASDIEAFKQDENVLCLVEYLPNKEMCVTHKFAHVDPDTGVLSIGPSFNANPPPIKIYHEEEVLDMFTVDFGINCVIEPQMVL